MATTPRTSKSAFTLVEMLVSIAVLVLIMTFIAQMMNSVTLSTTLSDKHIDTDSQARLVFDRMAMDIAGMPLENGLEYLFAKEGMRSSPGGGTEFNDKMFFFSNAPAYFNSNNADLFPSESAIDPKSNTALIGYCVNTGSNNTGATVIPPPYCLQRLSKGLTWDQGYPNQNAPGGLMFLTFPPLTSGSPTWTPYAPATLAANAFTAGAIGAAPDYSGTDSDFDTLANQVFRMEFCFQVKDLAPNGNGGSVFSNFPVAVYADSTSASTANNPTTYATTDPSTKPIGAVPHVGDRWYNYNDNRAFEFTGPTSAYINGNLTACNSWAPIGLSDVSAIVVAIAVMDSNSRKVLTQEQLSYAASYLPKFDNGKIPPSTPSGSPELMATAWEDALNSQQPRFSEVAAIPQSAAGQIRIYQRFFYLNQYQGH